MNMRLNWMIATMFATHIAATEVDSFTTRDPYMEDSLVGLNALMQGYFERALLEANKAKSCELQVIETALYDVSGGQTWAKIEEEVGHSNLLDRRTISRGNSIYQDITFIDGFGLYMAKLGYLMKIQDYYVGSDKIGHFIGIGYSYYQYPSLIEAMNFGELSERTYFGLATTAVYSHGDLMANYEGYFFWNRVAQGKNPYFTCQDNIWKQSAEFNWLDYMSPAWDEGINCNFYKTPEITQSVQKRIQKLGFSCPVDKKYCASMIKRYGSVAPRLITGECFKP